VIGCAELGATGTNVGGSTNAWAAGTASTNSKASIQVQRAANVFITNLLNSASTKVKSKICCKFSSLRLLVVASIFLSIVFQEVTEIAGSVGLPGVPWVARAVFHSLNWSMSR
jgi:hypothetical protein